MIRRAKNFGLMFKEAATEWWNDQAPVLGAALSYYTVFSLAPLLVLTIAIAGLAYGEEAARGEIVTTMQGLVGKDGAEAVEAIIENARKPSEGIVATILGFAFLVFGATGVFGQLQNALNMIWKVAPKPGATWKMFLRSRFLSFAMVSGVAFLLLVSLLASAALAALGRFFSETLPGGETVWLVLNFIISLGVITFMFAMIFKVLPDAKVQWKDVGVGAFMTAVLFSIGKFLMGLYLGNSTIGSTYGAAGSLVVLLIWVYYSAQILFLGAELTRVYAIRYGRGVRPEQGAQLLVMNPLTHQKLQRNAKQDLRR